ncbi:hypothetical protein PROSTU_02061 [Providencia stuartii ATCC 25827]|uniref:Uncharacterized protein n=1 Tax=Providencia stuartii ATCC 25827 TaxID=471874 RepID=A0AA86YKP1_PROST|nr:hypothetical protein PROSTU_02061 [Providencia stuartii ATCC 25827]
MKTLLAKQCYSLFVTSLFYAAIIDDSDKSNDGISLSFWCYLSASS